MMETTEIVLHQTEKHPRMSFRRVRQKYWQVQATPVGGSPKHLRSWSIQFNEDMINLSSFDGGERDMLGK
jgi:hypothetical protein